MRLAESEADMRESQASQTRPAASADADLIRRALARDETAVRAILRANNRRLYRLARSILRNDNEAEDVVQETYVRAFTHLAEFRGDPSLATWLSRIAINEALGRRRRERSGVDVASLPQGTVEAQIVPSPLGSTADDPEKSMARRQVQQVVESAIDELPEAFRLVFIARVVEGRRPQKPCR
jgi:RNA polymerase sigma-70 factor, ECF subfamily